MKNAILGCVMVASLAACSGYAITPPQTEQRIERKTIMNNKQIVGAFLGAVLQQDASKMRALANKDYIQHNPHLPTGLEAFIGMLPILKQHGTTAENVRMLADGNYVFMHNIWRNAKPFGADEMVSFDIIRLDPSGKVAEHWDALMPQTSANPSGRTLTDGATEVSDLDKTQANKAQVRQLFDTLIHGSPEQVSAAVQENFAPDYKQHNPVAADGLQGFMAAMPTEQWKFTKQHAVLGEGNFVLSISEGTHKGTHSVFYDLVRINKGKIVEHWDVIQAIPTQGLANPNGMFGFRGAEQ